MGAKIVVDFQPFAVSQHVRVFIDGSCKEAIFTAIDGVDDVVKDLKNKYNVKEINLCGNQSYLSKMQTEMISELDDSNCEINIIERG